MLPREDKLAVGPDLAKVVERGLGKVDSERPARFQEPAGKVEKRLCPINVLHSHLKEGPAAKARVPRHNKKGRATKPAP